MHDDRRFEADDVVAEADHGAPPGVLDVALEFGAERAIIPKAIDAAVDLRRREDEPAPFAQRHDLFHHHIFLRFGHRGGEFLGSLWQSQGGRATTNGSATSDRVRFSLTRIDIMRDTFLPDAGTSAAGSVVS